jgi:hypothetical protein
MNGFAARPKPPPEAGRTVVRAIGATLANRWFELKWIDSGSGRHALLQSLEQAAEAAGRDDRTGTLRIGPDG